MDATQQTQQSQQTAGDVAKLSGTISDYESGKIVAAQANNALQTEFDEITQHGDLSQVQQSFIQLGARSPLAAIQPDPVENPTYLPKEFPGLTLTDHDYDSNDQASFTFTNPTNNRQVALLMQPNASMGTASVESAADLQKDTTHAYAEKVAASANDYFTGKINATTTDAQINQELQTAKAAGVDLTNPSTYGNAIYGGEDFDRNVTFSLQTKNGSQFIGINADGLNGQPAPLERIEMTGGQANAQDVSSKVFLKSVGYDTAMGAASGGLIGAFASPVGAAIGAVSGAAFGATLATADYFKHKEPDASGQQIFGY